LGRSAQAQDAEPGDPADGCQPIEEPPSVLVVAENRLPIESSDHHMVEGARQIKAWTTRHVWMLLPPQRSGQEICFLYVP